MRMRDSAVKGISTVAVAAGSVAEERDVAGEFILESG